MNFTPVPPGQPSSPFEAPNWSREAKEKLEAEKALEAFKDQESTENIHFTKEIHPEDTGVQVVENEANLDEVFPMPDEEDDEPIEALEEDEVAAK